MRARCRRDRGPTYARSSQRLIEAIEQPCARFERRDIELLIMGVCALAVDAEPVERAGVGSGEIAVRAASGIGVDQLEADLGRESLGVLVQRGACIALLVRRTVELAGDLDGDALGL